MKRTMKKLVALALSVVMMLAMTITAMAATGMNNNNGKITVTNAIVGESYSVYQIFQLESYDEEKEAYLYTVLSDWEDFVSQESALIEIEDGYVTWKGDTNTDMEGFAKRALAYVDANSIEATQGPKEATTTTVEFVNLNLGYYLLDSSTGALCSLTTTHTDALVTEKNDTPTVDKEVKEDSTSDWGSENTAGIGEVVEYKATINAKKGADNYVLHDKMDAGLTWSGEVTVKYVAEGSTDEVDMTADTDYILVSNPEDEDTFDVQIKKQLNDGDKVVVYYTATVNENAVINGSNKNEIELEYGDGNRIENETVTKVYDIDVFKFETNTKPGTNTGLAGATFTLKDANGNIIKVSAISGRQNVYRVDANGVETIVTDTTGKFTIEGLDAGTYYLHEIDAPDGYNGLNGPIEVVISETGEVTYTYGEDEEVVADPDILVENKTGVELPETGGMGTTILYMAGILVMAAAVFYFVMGKKRREQ